MKKLATLLPISLLLAVAAGVAQTPPPACTGDEYRQFDFWLGEWKVLDGEGQTLGTNRIESILGGCVLRESWEGTSGSVGHSYNMFDRQTGRWHQTWVDNGGNLLKVEGGLDESGAMVLEGTGKARDGSPVRHRITWTLLEDGRVLQHWQSSPEGGEWSDAFRGYYAKNDDGGGA